MLFPKSEYSAKVILRWLWEASRGNRLQAGLNALLGLLAVGVSLAQVWAMQRAIDVAAGAVQGSIYWAVALMGGLVLCDFALNIPA
jgi:ABC-type multidrug transport system fused ATPase/permease subunit